MPGGIDNFTINAREIMPRNNWKLQDVSHVPWESSCEDQSMLLACKIRDCKNSTKSDCDVCWWVFQSLILIGAFENVDLFILIERVIQRDLPSVA